MGNGMDGYIKGKLAGMNYYRALQQHADAKPPTNPFSTAQYLAFVEWDRGFGDGFADAGLGSERRAA